MEVPRTFKFLLVVAAVLATPPNDAFSNADAREPRPRVRPAHAPVVLGDAYDPQLLTALGYRMFFTAWTPAHGRELWVTDATPAGTRLLIDLNSGPGDSRPHGLFASGDRICFIANAGTARLRIREAWCSDGTADHTEPILPLPDYPLEEGHVQEFIEVGERFFWLTDRRIWQSINGVARIVPMDDEFEPYGLTSFQGLLYFATTDHDLPLWRSDGTLMGTQPVRDFDGQGGFRRYPEMFTPAGPSFFYRERTSELWRSDGTEAGTFRLPQASNRIEAGPIELTPFGDHLVFSLFDSLYGWEPWISDGTPEGTHIVKDVAEGLADANPEFFTVVGSRVYFAADDGVSGVELWSSDGSADGTQRVLDLAPGEAGSRPTHIIRAPFDDGVIFVADADDGGAKIWHYRASIGAAEPLLEVSPDAGGRHPRELTTLGLRLLFVHPSGKNGPQLEMLDLAGPHHAPALSACIGEPGTGANKSSDSECAAAFDDDQDGDVDLRDAAAFFNRAGGTK